VDDKEKLKRFAAERAEQLKAGIRMQADTGKEVRSLLVKTQKEIAQILSGAPSDYKRWQLGELQRAVEQALAEFNAGGNATLQSGLSGSWQQGQLLIDAPLKAASLDISADLIAIDNRRLLAMRRFTTETIADVTAKLANSINSELARAAIGIQSPFEAAQAIAGKLQTGGLDRAGTIVRHQLGTAFSTAAQERQEQAVTILPGLKKQWRRSGKTHSRIEHDLIDGQIRDVDKPFELPNGIKLMHPRDPSAPIGETIHCGCTSIPWMESWEVKTPGRLAFTKAETDANKAKRLIADAF
tara:strand:- start:22481 stop:23374 length:894 start_codon:yes stop_codon:yes gene_type:complete